jgi:hypothetical protein
MTAATVQKPRVIGIVILSVLGGILGILAGIGLMSLPSIAASSGTTVEGWVMPLGVFTLILGILDLVAAVLLMMYKRLGIIIGLVSYGLAMLSNIWSAATGNGVNIIGILIGLAVLYYLYRYLTHEPEKSFFS